MMNLEECDIFEEKDLFSVSPNPSDGNVELTLNYEGKTSIQVFDVLGKMIYNIDCKDDSMIEINSYLTNLDAGVYVIKVFVEKYSQTGKLIKY